MKTKEFTIVLLLFLGSCSPIYLFNAGYTEARILASREDIKEALEEKDLDKNLKDKLTHILSIREFAKNLGLTPRGSYSSYSNLKDLPPSYVITAVESYSLKPITWWYPIVGSIPYKGYHDKEDAISEGRSIKEEGYDVSLRESIAFSTLGWFDDPVLQTVLDQELTNISITVFHEIMHSTLWIPNHPDFNETMAEAVGLVSALEYTRSKAPTLEKEVLKRLKYECHLAIAYQETYDALNNLFNTTQEKEVILKEKQSLYEKLLAKIITNRKILLNLESDPSKIEIFNNASFLSNYIYLKEFYSFVALYIKLNRSSSAFISSLKELQRDDPYQELKKTLGNDMQSELNTPIKTCENL